MAEPPASPIPHRRDLDDNMASENLPHAGSRVARGGRSCKVAPIAVFLRASCDGLGCARNEQDQAAPSFVDCRPCCRIGAADPVCRRDPALPGNGDARRFQVVLGQMLPEAKTPPAPQALPSQAAAVRQPEPTVEATEPAPAPVPEVPVPPPDQTAAVTAPPPPRRKPVVREPPKHVTHRTERPREPASEPTPASPRFAELPPAGIGGPQYPAAQPAAAAVGPAPVPGPDVTASYQAMISAWLESHKRYPESARERGEEGSATLRFRIDQSGRVLDYGYASTGY